MRYRIPGGIIIKTENAAKPESQPCTYLKSLITQLPQVSSSLDYGCGKLRYTNAILEKTDTLTLVDSEVQLSRIQTLKGIKTSIRDLVGPSNRITINNNIDFPESNARFDRAFCINVLSVIPLYSKRKSVLEMIRSKLRKNGLCLFVVQYRNSDFSRMRQMQNARPWRDGFLIDSLRGFSFYGLISPEKLMAMVKTSGFNVDRVKLRDGTVYLWATRT